MIVFAYCIIVNHTYIKMHFSWETVDFSSVMWYYILNSKYAK